MKQFKVTGMSCAACSALVERTVLSLKGVTECSVSLLTNSMGVDGTATEEEIIAAVEGAGYHATLVPTTSGAAILLNDERTPALKRRLISSIFVLLILLYFSMGYCMWNWPLPEFLRVRPISIGCIELVLSAIVIAINQQFFTSGFKSLVNRAPNMDTLVSLGSGASFLYSTAVLLVMMGEQETGYFELVEEHLHNLYFESAAMILTLITLGKLLESISKGRTTNAIKDLIHMQPREAHVIVDGKEDTIPVSEVRVGDIFVVRSGESIPFDGVIIEGNGAINESAITGESYPRDVSVGDSVRSATTNCTGYFKCRALKVGEDTTLAQIIRLVSDAAATKAPIAKTADRVSAVFVPVVLALAFITLIVWLILGRNIGFSVARAVSVLVISCPCALGLATPVAIMVGSGKGAKNGILFKNALALELSGRTNVIAMDKTGTITTGELIVTNIIHFIDETKLLNILYNVEKRSEHPLAVSITSFLENKYDENSKVREELQLTNFRVIAGRGISTTIADPPCQVLVGNRKYMDKHSVKGIEGEALGQYDLLTSCGKNIILVAIDNNLAGIIALADVIKDNCVEAVSELMKLGIAPVMLTGDNKKVAEYIGQNAGIKNIVSEILPQQKEEIIRHIKDSNKNLTIMMAGDGINDAPALTRADIGIAVGDGTDIAIESADIVIMRNDIRDIPAAIRLSRRVLCIIKENLFWAFIYNIICIPLAAGVYTGLFGWTLNPMIAAAAMSLSSFCVVMNSLRINLFDIHNSSKDMRHKKLAFSVEQIDLQLNGSESTVEDDSEIEKVVIMKKTMTIEGMMCPHCEARVKKILEEIDGVVLAEPDHNKGIAVIEFDKEIDDNILIQAVANADYMVVNLK